MRHRLFWDTKFYCKFKKALLVIVFIALSGMNAQSAYASASSLSATSNLLNSQNDQLPPPVIASDVQPDAYYQAKVLAILEEGKELVDGIMQEHQKLKLRILNGNEKGKEIVIDHGGVFAIQENQKVRVGEVVVIAKPTPSNIPDMYYIVDTYRLNNLWILSFIFFALAVFFGRKRGFTSVVGMLFSVWIIFYFIIPRILNGGSPFLTCILGAAGISIVSLYLSHGWNARTSIALVSTLVTLGIAIGIDLVFVHIGHLTGAGTEEAFYLQFDQTNLDLRGLLLGGIIIGVVGILDDVTTGQSAAVEEIAQASHIVRFAALYRSGLSVGREHIASLVNTLLLTYVGASFPLLLLLSAQKGLPLWFTLNNNFIAEEIVRTLVGSSVLVLAVPITTLFSAWFFARRARGSVSSSAPSH